MKPARVAVLGGGRSSEHEVSLASAASVCTGLREAGHAVVAWALNLKFDVVTIAPERDIFGPSLGHIAGVPRAR